MPHQQPLTKEHIITTAIHLADTHGIAKLSMRALGRELNVEAMSLYYHVADKTTLLDHMVDHIYSLIWLPQPTDSWQQALATRAHSARTTLQQHRWAIALLDSRTNPGPATLNHHDKIIGNLRHHGFTLPTIGHIVATLDSFIYGFAIQEAALPFTEDTGAADLASDLLAANIATDYPHLAAFAAGHVMQPGYTFAAEFDAGLTRIINSFATNHGHDQSPDVDP